MMMARQWWRSKYAIATHIALVWSGVTLYMNHLVDKERKRRDAEHDQPSGQRQSSLEELERHGNEESVPQFPSPKQPIVQDIVQGSGITSSTAHGNETSWKHAFESLAALDNTVKFDALAEKYDEAIQFEEMSMGINWMRKYLLKHAKV
jgi:hypothetical protein